MIYSKNQLFKRAEALRDQLNSLKDLFEELADDIESESSDIEPYEGRNDLTQAQEDRQNWLDETAESIRNAIGEIEEADDTLSGIDGM